MIFFKMVRMVTSQTGQMMFHHEGTPHVQYMSPQGPGQHPGAGQYPPPPQQGAPPPPQPPHFPTAMVCPVIPGPQTHMMQQTVQYIHHQHPQGKIKSFFKKIFGLENFFFYDFLINDSCCL